MSELIRREDLENWLRTECASIDTYEDKEYVIGRLREDLPTVNSWRMVEEPPEPHKVVLVTGMEAINNSRVYKVMVNDNGTWRPTDYAPSIRWDYWMPLPEPPKEVQE